MMVLFESAENLQLNHISFKLMILLTTFQKESNIQIPSEKFYLITNISDNHDN